MGCLILVLLLFVAPSSSAAHDFIVHPSDDPGACSQTAQLCFPLTHYLNDFATFNFTEARLVFLPGIHALPEREDRGVYTIRDVQGLSIIGQPQAVIRCSGSTGLAFLNITGLNLDNITVEKCGVGLTEPFLGNSTNLLDDNDLNLLGHGIAMRAALFMSLVKNLTLSGIIVTNSTGYGMIAVNLIGNTMIKKVQFSNNNLQALHDTQCTAALSRHCKGGNLVFIFTDTESVCPDIATTHTVLVQESVFRVGIDLTPAFQPFIFLNGEIPPFYGGGGIGLTLAQSTYGVNFILDNATLIENIAYTGSNLYITVFEQVSNFSITITNSKISYGNSMIESGDVKLTGLFVLATGFSFAYGIKPPLNFIPACIADSQNFQFNIEDSEFIKNNANLVCAGLLYLWGESSAANTRKITIQNSVFQDNRGDSIIAIFEISNFEEVFPFKIFMTNLTFARNKVSEQNGFARTFRQEIVVINSVRNIQFSGCLFQDNTGSPLRITESTVSMIGMNQFINNTAVVGSGLFLEEGSTIYFEPQSVTLFRDNHAETFGGAIYAVITSYKCFYQILSPDPDDFPRLIFQNNSASSAGDAVYGNVDNCLLEQFTGVADSDIVFSEISTFLDHTNEDSLITSTGHRLCLCSNGSSVPNCNDSLSLSLDTFPGQLFQFTVAVRGYDGRFGVGYTPANLHTDFVRNVTGIDLGRNQLIQQLSHGCSNLSFNFYAIPQTVTINLLASVGRVFNTFPIHVNLMPCPPGFQISNETSQTQCVCNDLIQDRQLTCDINTLTVSRNRYLWVGTSNQTGIPRVTIGVCPIAYCSQTRTTVNIDSADEQCSYNRSGFLCGVCSDGLSVAIGSSRCFECSNVYLLLILVFAVFGVLLILLLTVANLTIATGMINGLLFYANVVKVTNLQNNSPGADFLLPFSIFINWINLDFGIETCFYDGFDGYTKAWLQYVFPFYLFFLMGVAILVSSKSTKLSSVLPRNIVAVFATVLLISYTKLLRAAIVPFPFSRLYTSLDTFSVVWIYNGNLAYFGPKHAPLIVFSVIVALLLIFPYVFLLTTHNFLQKLSGKEDSKVEACFTWIRLKLFRLKPIFDAYDAPLKGGQRYWTGLLLILRTFIFFTVAVSLATRSPPVLNSAVVIVASTILLGMILTVGVYNQKKIRALECIHYINLASLEFINLILDLVGHSDGNAKAIVLSVSVAVAFILFLFAIVYQIYQKLQKKIPALEKFEVKMKMMYDDDTITATNATSHIDTVIDEIDQRRTSSYTLTTENNQVTKTTISIND